MKNVEIIIRGKHRGKPCAVAFSRRGKDWAAEIAIEDALHERATNERPCVATAERLIDEILSPGKKSFKRRPAGRELKTKLFGE